MRHNNRATASGSGGIRAPVRGALYPRARCLHAVRYRRTMSRPRSHGHDRKIPKDGSTLFMDVQHGFERLADRPLRASTAKSCGRRRVAATPVI